MEVKKQELIGYRTELKEAIEANQQQELIDRLIHVITANFCPCCYLGVFW